LHGGVAQVVEQAAHIRWVRGSNPFAAIFFAMENGIIKDRQYFKFSLYGLLKNLRFFGPFMFPLASCPLRSSHGDRSSANQADLQVTDIGVGRSRFEQPPDGFVKMV
jgi:hypothetical protein